MNTLKARRAEKLRGFIQNEFEVIHGAFKTMRTWQLQDCIQRMPLGTKAHNGRTVTVIAMENGHRRVWIEDRARTLQAELVYLEDSSVSIQALEIRHFGEQDRDYSSDALVRSNSLRPRELLLELTQAAQFLDDPETMVIPNPVNQAPVTIVPAPVFS
ncbi:MAG: hypothetical protein V4702_02730 [Patescibacteria group bacterium]